MRSSSAVRGAGVRLDRLGRAACRRRVDVRGGLPAPPAPNVSSIGAPGAITGAHRAASGANSGPAMITVGMAISRPSARVMPRSAFSTPMAASGPGCGGTKPCSTDSPASVGIAIFISG